MGKAIEITNHHGVITLMIDPFASFRAQPTEEGGFDFVEFIEVENLDAENEADTGKVVGYEMLNIDTIEASDIPDISETYDIPDMGIKDMTIVELLWLLE